MAAAVTALNCPVRIFLKYSEPAAPEAVCANYSARLKIAGKVAGVDRPVAVSASTWICAALFRCRVVTEDIND